MRKGSVALLRDVLECARMERCAFGTIWTDPDDPLPKTEAEVTEFIRRRTKVWRETWMIPKLEEVITKLTKAKKQ